MSTKKALKSEEWLGCVIKITENLQLSTEHVASNQPVMKQRSPVMNQRLVHNVSLRRNSDVSPSPLNMLWHQQKSSTVLLCSWFDRERSSAQEEKWRHDSLQLETSIWKHTHMHKHAFDLIHWLKDTCYFVIPVLCHTSWIYLYFVATTIIARSEGRSRAEKSTSRRLQDLNLFSKYSP